MICVFGEVLVDHFPDGTAVLGGAPFNVAWHLQGLGLANRLLTRIGNDANGTRIAAAMRDWGMDTSGVQRDQQRSTGTVQVSISNGEPTYEITTDAAWDALQTPAPVECDLLYHGSLALRSPVSARSLQRFKAQSKPRLTFIDINLRPPWWQRDQVQTALKDADWLKLNEDELHLLQPGSDGLATELLDSLQLEGLIVTRGESGAEVFSASGEYHRIRPSGRAAVIDTVGAGDAFSAVMIAGLSSGWSLPLCLERAQQFAAQIVSQRGATVADPAFYSGLIQQWQETN